MRHVMCDACNVCMKKKKNCVKNFFSLVRPTPCHPFIRLLSACPLRPHLHFIAMSEVQEDKEEIIRQEDKEEENMWLLRQRQMDVLRALVNHTTKS